MGNFGLGFGGLGQTWAQPGLGGVYGGYQSPWSTGVFKRSVAKQNCQRSDDCQSNVCYIPKGKTIEECQ